MTNEQTLFERLGGAEGCAAIAELVVENHLKNPDINKRFLDSDPAALKVLVRTFFAAGTGGPNEYEGRDMVTAHTGMNLNEREFVSTIDDVLAAIDERGLDAGVRSEVLAILYSFKDDILFR
ncbi:MAG: group 1 truncated hemoglobin [Planctomycetes bacterium]|nr:group 1 truncated hemoglobin [Planctomycetota bacterium]